MWIQGFALANRHSTTWAIPPACVYCRLCCFSGLERVHPSFSPAGNCLWCLQMSGHRPEKSSVSEAVISNESQLVESLGCSKGDWVVVNDSVWELRWGKWEAQSWSTPYLRFYLLEMLDDWWMVLVCCLHFHYRLFSFNLVFLCYLLYSLVTCCDALFSFFCDAVVWI
jgi:hypothetical protein